MRDLELFAVISFLCTVVPSACAGTWECEILPPERKVEIDETSGAKVTFVTTHPGTDTNLYFHKRCFLWDNRLMLFYSDRFGRTETMGYLVDAGELIRLNPADAPAAGAAVASVKGDRLFVVKGSSIYVWKLEIETKPKTTVRVTEREVMAFPDNMQQRSFIVENCDSTLLAFSYLQDDAYYIGWYDMEAGEMLPPAKLDFKPDHMQFHWDRPDLMSFCRVYEKDIAPLDPVDPAFARIWFMNVHTRVPLPAFYMVPGEITTHECWWVNDQMTFIGGHHHEGDREEGNVKVFDLKTGDIRIIGAGAWLEDASGYQLSQVNWWHASGSPNGKWVAADNWHGTVALFNGKTTEKKILTTGHRTYGGGLHLHVGWDLNGECVEFTSSKLGNPDVCIAEIPEDW